MKGVLGGIEAKKMTIVCVLKFIKSNSILSMTTFVVVLDDDEKFTGAFSLLSFPSSIIILGNSTQLISMRIIS